MKKTIILLFFILIKFLIQYSLINPEYDLHRDEYLHLDQANHLAWGYLSVPPMTSWISIIIKFLGNSVFWIQFFPALFGALTMFFIWKAIEELKGNLFALILGASCVMFSVLFRLNMLYQPNSLDVLCWTAIFYLIIKYLNTDQVKWIYWIAITFAIGVLNKYNIIFLIFGLIPAILLTPERKILFNKHLYFAVLLAIIIIAPNLIWQYDNGFPVIHHMRVLSETQLVNVNRWSFIKSQFLFFPGTFVVFFFGFYALITAQNFKKYRFFLWSFFITIAIFLLLKAKDYYAIGLYPIYFAFGSVYIASLLENRIGKLIKPVLIILILVLFIPIYKLAFPNQSPQYILTHPALYQKFGLLNWEDGKSHQLPQDFADMQGWKELAKKVDEAYGKMPSPERTLVLCDNYGQAGAINYYSKKEIRAVSFNADYINWFDLKKKYTNLIRVKEYKDSKVELKKTAPLFQKSFLSGSVDNSYSREYRTAIFSFINANVDINKRIEKEIEEEKF